MLKVKHPIGMGRIEETSQGGEEIGKKRHERSPGTQVNGYWLNLLSQIKVIIIIKISCEFIDSLKFPVFKQTYF